MVKNGLKNGLSSCCMLTLRIYWPNLGAPRRTTGDPNNSMNSRCGHIQHLTIIDYNYTCSSQDNFSQRRQDRSIDSCVRINRFNTGFVAVTSLYRLWNVLVDLRWYAAERFQVIFSQTHVKARQNIGMKSNVILKSNLPVHGKVYL